MITLSAKGDLTKTEKFLDKISKGTYLNYKLEMYGQRGVNALAASTPRNTGVTSASWYYEVVRDGKSIGIYWKNSNVNDGYNIAVLIQYGHGTRSGSYVQGIDYINPALKPLFNDIAEDIWKEVTD